MDEGRRFADAVGPVCSAGAGRWRSPTGGGWLTIVAVFVSAEMTVRENVSASARLCPANAQSGRSPRGPRSWTVTQIVITASTSSADALTVWLRLRRCIPDQSLQAFACYMALRMLDRMFGKSTTREQPYRQKFILTDAGCCIASTANANRQLKQYWYISQGVARQWP